jgi:hypothetical protein
MEAMAEEHVNVHKAEMFDAIRDFFVELTGLLKMVAPAIEAQLKVDAARRK